MAQAATSENALWSGTYKASRASFATDVWPGDALQLNAPSTNLNAQVVLRTVKLSYRGSYPDLVEYALTFANDWADDLAIKTSATVPADTWLPAVANPTPLQNLNALTVTAIIGNTVTIQYWKLRRPPAEGLRYGGAIRIYARRRFGAGDAWSAANNDVHPGIGERPLLYKDV